MPQITLTKLLHEDESSVGSFLNSVFHEILELFSFFLSVSYLLLVYSSVLTSKITSCLMRKLKCLKEFSDLIVFSQEGERKRATISRKPGLTESSPRMISSRFGKVELSIP